MTAAFGWAAYSLVFTIQFSVHFCAACAMPAHSAVLDSVSFILVQYLKAHKNLFFAALTSETWHYKQTSSGKLLCLVDVQATCIGLLLHQE